MTTITKITPTFYRCAETLGRIDFGVTVIASTWRVSFSDLSTKQYNVTLSPDKLDPEYDSRKDSHRSSEARSIRSKFSAPQPKNYYIQIDDSPKFIESLFKKTISERSLADAAKNSKDHILCPKNDKVRPLYFYVISPKDFEQIPKNEFDDISNTKEKIDAISKNTILTSKAFFSSNKVSEKELTDENPTTINRIKRLELDEFESKLLFHELFEQYLIIYIQAKNPAITDERAKKATERTPLVNNQTCSCCTVV